MICQQTSYSNSICLICQHSCCLKDTGCNQRPTSGGHFESDLISCSTLIHACERSHHWEAAALGGIEFVNGQNGLWVVANKKHVWSKIPFFGLDISLLNGFVQYSVIYLFETGSKLALQTEALSALLTMSTESIAADELSFNCVPWWNVRGQDWMMGFLFIVFIVFDCFFKIVALKKLSFLHTLLGFVKLISAKNDDPWSKSAAQPGILGPREFCCWNSGPSRPSFLELGLATQEQKYPWSQIG